MAPLNIGEAGRVERVLGLLVSGNYFSSLGLAPAARPVPDAPTRSRRPAASRSWSSPTTTGRTASAPRMRRRRPDASSSTTRPDHRRRHARRFQGTMLGLQFDLWVPATMAPVLLAGSRELEDRRLRGYSSWAGCAPTPPLAQAQAEVDRRRCASWRRRYPGSERTMQRRSAAVLAGAARAAADACDGARDAAGRHAPRCCSRSAATPPTSCSRAPAPASARSASAWRSARAVAHRAPAAGRERLLGVDRARRSASSSRCGAPMRCAPCRCYGAFPVRFQTSVDGVGLLFAIGLGIACGAALRRRAGAAAGARRSAAGAARRRAGAPARSRDAQMR